jgi:hypothetical protein
MFGVGPLSVAHLALNPKGAQSRTLEDEEAVMVCFCLRPSPDLTKSWATVAAVLLLLAGCASMPSFGPSSEPPPAAPSATLLPASIPAQDLVGRWGLAAYHKVEDRARTETAARGQCRQPYNISRGPTGGVIMHLADQSQPTELVLKGGPGGQNFVGPGDEPGGSARDREIVSMDGRVMVLRWVDPEISGRYGNMVYVRCGTAPDKPAKKRPGKKKAKAAPAAPPPPPPAGAPK